MAQMLRQSTQVVVQIGPFVDVTDGFTPEVGITLSGADEAEALKAGATTTTDISAATWVAITGCDGWYALTLTTSHTDTVGTFRVIVQDDSVCLPVHCVFQIVEENVFDMIYAASGDLGTTIDIIAADVVNIDGAAMRGTDSAALASVCTEARLSELDAATGGKMANQVDIIEIDTTSLNDTKIPDTLSLANINAQVDTAIADARLDELLAADSDIDGVAPPTVGSVFHELMSKTPGSFTFDQTTDSNEAIRDKETDIETDTAEIGVAGAGLTNINLPNQTMDITGNITGNLSGSVGSVADGIRIEKNTALANFMFLMVDSTDHVTPKTGLTITATRSIDGAAFAACSNTAAEVANGIYKINLAATDLNGDVITFRFVSATADDRLITIVTTI